MHMQQINMFDILGDQPTDTKKSGKIISNVGEIAYSLFGENNEYVKFRNITLEDFFWSILSVTEFDKRFRNNCKAIETFTSERLTGFNSDKIIVNADSVYHLMTKKKFDGYLYEINATLYKSFPKKNYPKAKFPYTKYHINSLVGVSLVNLESMKAAETVRFNRDVDYNVYTVSAIANGVYDFINRFTV